MQAADRAAPPLLREDSLSTKAAEALMRKDYDTVLALTATTGDAPVDAWLDCDRGAALVALNRTDEAVAAYRRAEVRFDRNRDADGARKALWGEARAFAEVGRCDEARSAYGRYETASRNVRPGDAQLAASYAGLCVDRGNR
jgi:tetratricopeptide (TPR) repeat protein